MKQGMGCSSILHTSSLRFAHVDLFLRSCLFLNYPFLIQKVFVPQSKACVGFRRDEKYIFGHNGTELIMRRDEKGGPADHRPIFRQIKFSKEYIWSLKTWKSILSKNILLCILPWSFVFVFVFVHSAWRILGQFKYYRNTQNIYS